MGLTKFIKALVVPQQVNILEEGIGVINIGETDDDFTMTGEVSCNNPVAQH
jgi:hypothetical protein